MSYAVRYYFTFFADRDTRIVNGTPDEWQCDILQSDYAGASEEIQAQQNPVQIVYQNTNENKMQPIRGSECTLNLLATSSFSLADLYTENEREFLVQIYRNGIIIWRGFIIPDGCQEQFMFTPYPISVNAVDTLGLLKNLSYVQNDGNFWVGKQSFLDIIYNCINRIAIPNMNIYTCVNIYEVAQTQGDLYDPLAMTYTEAERFLKEDTINQFNCEDVLKAVMEEWTATIIQSEGDFYVFRPSELALSSTLVFRKYEGGQAVYDGYTVSKDLYQKLGGESEGVVLAPLFHINTDQLKMIVKPYKNASMSYLYGVNQNPDEELDNPNLEGASRDNPATCPDPLGPCDNITVPGYTKTGTMYLGINPTGGVIFYSDGGPNPTYTNYYENDNVIPVTYSLTVKNYLTFVINYENPAFIFGVDMNFFIILDSGSTTYYLQQDGSWDTPAVGYKVRSASGTTGTLTIRTDIVPASGNVSFRILAPSGTFENIIYTSISGKVYLNLGDQIGEIHTATQRGIFTFVPETIDVFNGDSDASLYMGAMFLSDETTLTALWNRRGIPESILAEPYAANKPFLRIAVEEIQRMHALPYAQYDGSIFGYFSPLSYFVINLFTGVFMPIGLQYDLQDNICQARLIRISNDEIAMDYTLEPDYGETTKVTVKSAP
jgi:hypothetical protein